MKKRVAKCCVLVGWEDAKEMTKPQRCGERAALLLVPYRLPACARHAKVNEGKDLTYAPKKGPMVGAGKGSRYEKIA